MVDGVLNASGFRITAQLREVQHMVDSLDQGRPTRLHCLQERSLAVVQWRVC